MSRRILVRVLVLLVIGMGLFVMREDMARWQLGQAHRAFSRGDLRGALAGWSSATRTASVRRTALYNRGVARYRLGDLAGAGNDFRLAAASETAALRQQAHYNLGTTLLAMERAGGNAGGSAAQQQLTEAVRHLQTATALDPKDAAARHNLTLAQARLSILTAGAKSKQRADGSAGQQPQGAGRGEPQLQSPGTATEKGGKATDADTAAAKRRRAPSLSQEQVLRMLDDVRGREVLRSAVAADKHQGTAKPPEKDW
jgi:tetratricopeptide (TPR) repeat protein